jgi:hypothetical protein
MSTDTEVRLRGLRALVETLGPVDAERFITLILREPFDYTQWQRHLWADKSVAELSQAAMPSVACRPVKHSLQTPRQLVPQNHLRGKRHFIGQVGITHKEAQWVNA